MTRYFVCFCTAVGIVVAIAELFYLPYGATLLVGQGYLFALIAFFLPVAALFFWRGPTWSKFLASALAFGVPFYFFLTAEAAFSQGWEVVAPLQCKVIGLVLLLLILVLVQRVSGWPLAIVCLLAASLPLFASFLPGFLRGASFGFWQTVTFHALGTESIVGLPMRVVAQILIGYLVFGGVLTGTGGGKFFMDLALAILGKYRGGAAKVSVLSSAFFGSLSGSVAANIVTTGSLTIPTMKRSGFPPHYAGALEACASTGGVLMPPIMGATAFIMAEFLAISYLQVVIAAIIPSILYYLSLLLQVDYYAAKHGLEGLPREHLPSLRMTLKDGWPFLVSIIVLMWLLVIARLETQAPFYASGVLLLTVMLRKKTRLNFQEFLGVLAGTGRIIANIIVILLGVGLLIGSLSMTGLAFSFCSTLTALSRGSLYLLIGLGAIASYILGMGMTVSACYIFLAIIAAPALIQAGLNPIATHLFFLYCGMLSYITPPVAVGAFVAAPIAGAGSMRTALTAMRLGVGIWILPFVFILVPSLVFQGPILEGLTMFFITALSFWVIAQGAEGFAVKVGEIRLVPRIFLILAGAILIFAGILVLL